MTHVIKSSACRPTFGIWTKYFLVILESLNVILNVVGLMAHTQNDAGYYRSR